MEETKEVPKINKGVFNDFIIHLRPKIRNAICYTTQKLTSNSKSLKRRKNLNEESLKKKLNRIEEQIAAIKSFNFLDIAKFVVLVQKPLDYVINDTSASAEQIALTRIAYEKIIQTEVQDLRSKYPNWAKEIPNIIKCLGIKYRKNRLEKLKKCGKDSEVLKSEKKLLILLNEAVNLGVDPRLLEGMNAESLLSFKEKRKKLKKEKKEILGQFKKKLVIEESKQVEGKDEEEEEKQKDESRSNDSSNKSFINSTVQITSIFDQIGDDDDDDDEDDDDVESDKEEEKKLKKNNRKKLENKSKIIKQNDKNNNTNNKNYKNNKRKINDSTNLQKISTNPSEKKILKTHLSTEENNEDLTKHSSTGPSIPVCENEIIKKQNRGTSKVTILDLSKIGKEKKGDEEESESELLGVRKRKGHSSESEDEDFLKNESIPKKKKSKSSFFVGRMESTNSDSDDSDVEDHTQTTRPELNNRLKRKIINDDSSEYDSSKFFKKKIFRTGNSSNQNKDEKFVGRGNVRGGGERGFRGGRGRGSFRDANKNLGGRTEGDKGKFDSRGRGRGRSQFGNNDRRKNFSKESEAKSFNESGRGRGSGSRRGFTDKGRGRQNENNGKKCSDFSGSSNFEVLGSRKSAPNKTDSGSMLHPSWVAKKLQMEQIAKTAFQGKKIVFDDD